MGVPPHDQDIGPARAPALDERPAAIRGRSRATSRPLWVIAYVAILVVLAIRLPQAYEYLQTRIPGELSQQIHDPEMESFALKAGMFVAYVLTALIIGIYLSLAGALERKVFTVGKPVGHGLSVGLYFSIMVLCTIPVHIGALIFAIPNPRSSPVYYVYIVAVGLLAPFAFHSVWRRLPVRKIAVLFTSTLTFSLLTVIG